MSETTNLSERGRVITVSSGKGGVGKTNLSVNLAIALAQRGSKVCVFDADTSLANVNILLNLRPHYTLEQLLDGSRKIEEILLAGPGGISIVPAASGIAEFASLTAAQQKILLNALSILEHRYDYLIIDTAAGISDNVTTFLQATEHCLLIVTPEPTSLTDAFALMKVMRKRHCETKIHILTNMVDNYPGSVDLYKRLSSAATRYLQTDLNYLGYIPRDDYVRLSVQRQVPVTLGFPSSRASHRFQALAESIAEIYRAQPGKRSFSLFWRKLFLNNLKKNPGTISVTPTTLALVAAGVAEPASSASRYPRAMIVKMQQNMVQLVRSRTLSPQSMKNLLESVLLEVDRYYPKIDTRDLKRSSGQHRRLSTLKSDEPGVIPMNLS